MLVGEWGEGDRREPSTLQPVHSGGVNSYRLLCCDVGAILWEREEEGGGRKEGRGGEGKGGGNRGREEGSGSIKVKARFQNTWESSRRLPLTLR